jgi:hypothetical protein
LWLFYLHLTAILQACIYIVCYNTQEKKSVLFGPRCLSFVVKVGGTRTSSHNFSGNPPSKRLHLLLVFTFWFL